MRDVVNHKYLLKHEGKHLYHKDEITVEIKIPEKSEISVSK